MYEKFADLTRRMDAAEAAHNVLMQERDALIRDNDIEIGTHPVTGGQVVVSRLGTQHCITFNPIDAETQQFAARYALYCRDLIERNDYLKAQGVIHSAIHRDRSAYWRSVREKLVPGEYVVDGGIITVTDLGVTFDACP
jgi:hypothetical protein